MARCTDCGGELEDRHDDGGSFEPAAASRIETGAHEPLSGARPLAFGSEARDLVPLADALLQAGLAFRITPRGRPGEERPRGYDLRVEDQDREEARRIVAPLGDLGGGVSLFESVISDTGGPADDQDDAPSCPACQAQVPASAIECPECGLGLEREDPA